MERPESCMTSTVAVAAVVFDLDGVLVDSETVWDNARREVVASHGGAWLPNATREMMGMSSTEWSAYIRDRLGVALSPNEISDAVVALVEVRYEEQLPLLPGARETVHALAARWPLGLASSSNRPIIERFLDASGLRGCFTVSVSSEEVARGKPAPDVYLEAARRLAVAAERCIAIEDSTNGIHAAAAARMRVVALPNSHFPPAPEALELATFVITGLDEITAELIETAGQR
jgi:HAD superfamily hydrolase (TIGR01509 family)